MKNQPPVSIFIITCLGTEARGEVLKTICENALSQRYPEFEVVVSDNAGSFPAASALKAIKDPRLKVFRNKKNLGFNGNMNLCLERCRYDIIKLNCDDDLLHPDFLNITVPYVDDDTCVVVDYEKYIIGHEPVGISTAISTPPEVETRRAGYRNDIWRFPYISLPGCTIFTRQLFLDLGRYDTQAILPDFDFLIEARRRKNVTHVKSKLCYMGIWEESVTQQQLKTTPFYFAYETMYTNFRYLHDETLGFKDRMYIWFIILRRFLWESLRVPRHIISKRYRSDYMTYLSKLKCYICFGKKNYEHRLDGSIPGAEG
jgi:glycosyltransferase involved in cell wall biosynthesis